MRKRLIVIVFLLSALAYAANANAQTTTFKTRVPFPFVVGNQTLPAGTYQVQRLLGRPLKADQVGLIVIRSTDPLVFKAVVTNLVQLPPDSKNGSRLVFANRGGQHYLSEVHVQREKCHQIPNSPQPLEFAGSDVSREEVAAELH